MKWSGRVEGKVIPKFFFFEKGEKGRSNKDRFLERGTGNTICFLAEYAQTTLWDLSL